MKIRQAKIQDCKEINRLMKNLIDEIYAKESVKVRKILKANFTSEALRELCKEKQVLIFTVVMDKRLVAFIYGWLFHNEFTIYWMYCQKEYRNRGIAKKLLNFVEQEMKNKGCYKLEMYAYAKHNKFLDFCYKLGFKKGVLINKNMFGIKLQNIYKYINHEMIDKEIKIKIIGEAGQGVKLMSYTLASILAHLGKEVTLNLEYDSAVRSGVISADLIYSGTAIKNPVIDEADIMIKFAQTRDWFPARNLIIDESICGTKDLECTIKSKKGTEYGFTDVAISKFGSKIFINMIALGRILRYIGINIMIINIKDLLPPKSVEKNLEAIKYGFNFRDDV